MADAACLPVGGPRALPSSLMGPGSAPAGGTQGACGRELTRVKPGCAAHTVCVGGALPQLPLQLAPSDEATGADSAFAVPVPRALRSPLHRARLPCVLTGIRPLPALPGARADGVALPCSHSVSRHSSGGKGTPARAATGMPPAEAGLPSSALPCSPEATAGATPALKSPAVNYTVCLCFSPGTRPCSRCRACASPSPPPLVTDSSRHARLPAAAPRLSRYARNDG